MIATLSIASRSLAGRLRSARSTVSSKCASSTAASCHAGAKRLNALPPGRVHIGTRRKAIGQLEHRHPVGKRPGGTSAVDVTARGLVYGPAGPGLDSRHEQVASKLPV